MWDGTRRGRRRGFAVPSIDSEEQTRFRIRRRKRGLIALTGTRVGEARALAQLYSEVLKGREQDIILRRWQGVEGIEAEAEFGVVSPLYFGAAYFLFYPSSISELCMAAVGTLQSARDDCSTGESEGGEREGKERKCGMRFCPFPARVRIFIAAAAHATLPHAPARDTTRQYIDASSRRSTMSMDDLWWRRPRLPSSASTGIGRRAHIDFAWTCWIRTGVPTHYPRAPEAGGFIHKLL
ncbi:hypothetical protein C8R44DRAFT_947439, partial [Mycena epipterygia]